MSLVIDEVQCAACLKMIPVNDYIGLCECGNAVYDLPESDDYSYDVENDGG
jgi:hypothetical protein